MSRFDRPAGFRSIHLTRRLTDQVIRCKLQTLLSGLQILTGELGQLLRQERHPSVVSSYCVDLRQRTGAVSVVGGIPIEFGAAVVGGCALPLLSFSN